MTNHTLVDDAESRARALRKRMHVKRGPPSRAVRIAVARAVGLAVAAERARRQFMNGEGSAESAWRLDAAASRAEADALGLTTAATVETESAIELPSVAELMARQRANG